MRGRVHSWEGNHGFVGEDNIVLHEAELPSSIRASNARIGLDLIFDVMGGRAVNVYVLNGGGAGDRLRG